MLKVEELKLKARSITQKTFNLTLMFLVSVVAFCYVLEGGVILPTLKKYLMIAFMFASKIWKVAALLVADLFH